MGDKRNGAGGEGGMFTVESDWSKDYTKPGPNTWLGLLKDLFPGTIIVTSRQLFPTAESAALTCTLRECNAKAFLGSLGHLKSRRSFHVRSL